jgi:hypothetical protein
LNKNVLKTAHLFRQDRLVFTLIAHGNIIEARGERTMRQTGVREEDGQMRVPWYSLHPRHIRWRVIVITMAAFLLLTAINEKHVWRWSWEHGLHARVNCRAVNDVHGRSVEAWRWVEGREILVYVTPEVNRNTARCVARAIEDLLSELKMPLSLSVQPAPPRVLQAIERSTTGAGDAANIDFMQLCRELVATRRGQYAEVVFAPGIIDRSPDVVGAGLFTYGVILLNAEQATPFTARHEAGHLLGYHLHDDWPIVVLGYHDLMSEKYLRQDKSHEPLMMPWNRGYALSERSREALIYFWRGLERRTAVHLAAN